MPQHERLWAQPELGHGHVVTPQPGKVEASHLHPAKPQGATATSRTEQQCSVTTARAAAWSFPVHITKVPFRCILWAFFAIGFPVYQSVGPKTNKKKKQAQSPVCAENIGFLTTQTWPQSRKADPQHCAEQEKSPIHVDLTPQGRAKANTQTEARLENKHISKKEFT